ncbi:hypothetical protein PGB90_009072 [Kerria lacca]
MLISLILSVKSIFDFYRQEQKKSALSVAMEKSVCDMKASTYPKYLLRCDLTEIFVTSAARTNLEIEIVQWGGSLLKPIASSSLSSSSPSSSRDNIPSLITKKSSCIRKLSYIYSKCEI